MTVSIYWAILNASVKAQASIAVDLILPFKAGAMIAMVIAALVVAFVALVFSLQLLGKESDEQLDTPCPRSPSPRSPSPRSPSPRPTTSVPVASPPDFNLSFPGPPSSPLSDWEILDMYEEENPQRQELKSPSGRHTREVRRRTGKGVKATRARCRAKHTC